MCLKFCINLRSKSGVSLQNKESWQVCTFCTSLWLVKRFLHFVPDMDWWSTCEICFPSWLAFGNNLKSSWYLFLYYKHFGKRDSHFIKSSSLLVLRKYLIDCLLNICLKDDIWRLFMWLQIGFLWSIWIYRWDKKLCSFIFIKYRSSHFVSLILEMNMICIYCTIYISIFKERANDFILNCDCHLD